MIQIKGNQRMVHILRANMGIRYTIEAFPVVSVSKLFFVQIGRVLIKYTTAGDTEKDVYKIACQFNV